MPGKATNGIEEQLEIAGHQLQEKVQELLAQGHVRRLTIRSETGEIFVDVPLTAGVVAGGIFVLTTPWLVLLGAIAGLLAKVHLEVTYSGTSPETKDEQPLGEPK